MRIYGYICLAVGMLFLAAAIRYLIVCLGFRKDRVKHTGAYLERTEHEGNHRFHSRSGEFIHDITTAHYSYTVDGKKYTIERTVSNVKPHHFPPMLQVIYQPKHPDRAYLKDLTFPAEPFICGAMAFLALVFFANGIYFSFIWS